MLKAAGRTGDGRPLLVLGLSKENMTRLAADDPMVLDTAPLGLPSMQIVIVYGATEDTIIDRLHNAKLLDLSAEPLPSSTNRSNEASP